VPPWPSIESEIGGFPLRGTGKIQRLTCLGGAEADFRETVRHLEVDRSGRRSLEDDQTSKNQVTREFRNEYDGIWSIVDR
jgi:hypothetical protein